MSAPRSRTDRTSPGRHRTTAILVLWIVPLLAARPAVAGIDDWKGHLSLGYAKLFDSKAPAGGFSIGAGLDYPVGDFRLGPDIGYHLLGTRSLTSGTLNANLDYGLFEAGIRAHWQPPHAGPLARVSFGPSLMAASAQVSSSSGGLAFEKDEVSEVAGGAALDLALFPSRAVVGVGLELGTRVAWLHAGTWKVGTARLVLHY